MKEAIGGTWLFGIVILFISVFACFISISVNWSKCYKVKDEIIFLIQKDRGINKTTINDIANYMSDVGYRSTGDCSKNSKGSWYGFTIQNTNSTTMSSNRANYCIQKHPVAVTAIGHPKTAYYSVKVFFKLDVPILGDIIKLTVEGETSNIANVNDELIKNA